MAKEFSCNVCGDSFFTELEGGLLKCRSCKHISQKPKDNAELMERAENLRLETKDFDEAAKLYEEIIRLTPDESGAYWGKVLCRFGIEYVKDKNGEYLPTCHRTISSSILEDANYLMAVSKAEGEMKEYYKAQAQLIDTYQKNIKLIASKEEPYDVFISFKATDDKTGEPTHDSLIAQEIYYYLTKNLGLKVFFSNITLKDKAGREFEPIIYAALSSATVMVLVGTRPEYINATWVKNEWSRYLGMIDAGKREGKSKYIISAISGMKPEELPSSLAGKQAVNIGELGAKEKLCSNIDSLIGDLRVAKNKVASGTVSAEDTLAAKAANLCNLGFQQLLLGNEEKADEYFEKALEEKYDTALAYWGKLFISEDVTSDEELANKVIHLKGYSLYKIAMENATAEEKLRFEAVGDRCENNIERADAKTRHNSEYRSEIEKMKYAFAKCYKDKEIVSVNEETDAVFDRYIKKNEEYEVARKKLNRTEAKKSLSFMWIILCVLVAVFVLVPSYASEKLLTAVDTVAYESAGIKIEDVYRNNDISVSDFIEIFDSYPNLSLTEYGVSEEQNEILWVGLYEFDLFEAQKLEVLMLAIPTCILSIIIVALILKLFLSTGKAIFIGLFLGSFASIFLMGLFMLSAFAETNWADVVGWSILGFGVLMLVLGILKNIRLKSKINVLRKEKNVLLGEYEAVVDDLILYSAKNINAINYNYQTQYGNEIDAYEPSYCVALESLSATDGNIKRLLGVETVIHATE